MLRIQNSEFRIQNSKGAFLAILLVYLALAVAYSVAEPLGEAPDEADHYNYITYIGLNRSLPEGPAVTQSKHPPLYHATAAALTAWTGLDFSFLRSNPDAMPLGPDKPPNLFVHTTLEDFPWRGGALAMHLARFLSIAFGAVTVWSAWRLGSIVFPQRPAIGLLAAGFLAGLPGFLFISGSVNNDNAAGAFGSLVLVLCALTLSRGLSWRRSAWMGLFLGLGLLSKVGTLALWPLVALAAGGAWWLDGRARGMENAARRATGEARKGERWHGLPALAGHLVLAWGLGLLIASPWLLRNVRLYGDPFGWSLVRATVDQRAGSMGLADVAWLLRGFHRTFWGRFGGAGQIELPVWAQVAAAVFTVVVVVGAVRFVVSSVRYQVLRVTFYVSGVTKSRSEAKWKGRASDAEDASSSFIIHHSSLLFQLTLLALAPLLSFLSVVRYSAIALGTDQARLMWPALAAMAVWVGVGIVGLADWARESGKRERSTINSEQSAVNSERPAVNSERSTVNSEQPAEGRSVAQSASRGETPGAAREPSNRRQVRQDARLVAGFVSAMAAFGLVVLLGQIRPGFAPPEPVARAGSQPGEVLARFGDRLALAGVELPAEPVPAGQAAAVRLLWWSGGPLAGDLRPTVRLVHQDGWLAAEWSHSPAGGRYATDRWQPGEVVADDYLLLPQPSSPGVYTVQVGVRPFGQDWLSPQPRSSADPFLAVGQVTYGEAN